MAQIGGLDIEDAWDEDDEIALTIDEPAMWEDATVYLNREQVGQLRDHLTKLLKD